MPLLLLLLLTAGCVPIHRAPAHFVGHWCVKWQCGTERLVLRSDSVYTQSIEFSDGRVARHEGRWTVDGNHVVLADALVWCDPSAKPLATPEREEVRLGTSWEWGREVLEFNPDWQGFERDR